MEILDKITSMAYNNIVSGLHALNANSPITMQEVEDKLIITRLDIIYEYYMKGMLPKHSMLSTLNNIKVDCKSMSCSTDDPTVKHIEIPAIAVDLGINAIDYLGSTDKMFNFTIYTNPRLMNIDKFRKVKNKRPYVFIDTTLNSNGMNDVFIFNAPFLQEISIRAIFADPRQVDDYNCCSSKVLETMETLTDKIIEKAVNSYLTFYRKLTMQKTPNDQTIKNQ